MKIIERKTNLEGTAVLNNEGMYEVAIADKEVKTIAESTFKRNYKVVKEEESLVEMAMNPEIIEPEVVEKEEKEETVVELVDIVEVDDEVAVMAMNPEIIEPEVVEVKTEKTEKIEVVLTEEDEAIVKEAVFNLSNVIKALPVTKVAVEKNGHNSKLIMEQVGMVLTVNYKNSLMENIAEELKEKMLQDSVEVEFKNTQKRPNPAAFKARGVKVTGADGEEKTFKTRNDAMIWITNKYENNELFSKAFLTW